MNKDSKIGMIIGTALMVVILCFIINFRNERDIKRDHVVTQENLKIEIVESPEHKGKLLLVPANAKNQVTAVLNDKHKETETSNINSVVTIESKSRSPRYYIVQPQDNLFAISESFYASGRYVDAIYQANLKVMISPDHVKPGMKLRIPYPSEIAVSH